LSVRFPKDGFGGLTTVFLEQRRPISHNVMAILMIALTILVWRIVDKPPRIRLVPDSDPGT